MNQTRDSDVFQCFQPRSWEEARHLGRLLGRYVFGGGSYVFRGQADANWPLATSLERGIQRFQDSLDHLPGIEERILTEFRRRAHHFVNSLPAENDKVEWLSLIQHHGGPTRLLDFTRSFYVAAYFAVEAATSDAAVWAIDEKELTRRARTLVGLEKLEKSGEAGRCHQAFVNSLSVHSETIPMIINVEPERLGERLSIQQGLFLVPCKATDSFECNLLRTFQVQSGSLSEHDRIEYTRAQIPFPFAPIIKIILPRERHRPALDDLQGMNITAGTLFPGLDGFTRSLAYHLRRLESDAETIDLFTNPHA